VTITLADFINVLTLLLVAIILILLWQVWQRYSQQTDKALRSSSAVASTVVAAAPEVVKPKSKKDRWNALTLHQRNIATLAAEGKQNGEIAHALGIRTSTVSSHLKSIYKTLDIHSRRELANLLQEVEG